MDKAALAAEINNDPAGIGYADYVTESPGRIADMMNARTQQMHKPRMVTARGIMASYGLGPTAGAAFLDKLQSLSATVPAIRWAMKFLESEAGIDVGESATQLMIASLVSVGGISQQEVDAIKAMALQPAIRAEVVFGNGAVVTEAQVREAINGNV